MLKRILFLCFIGLVMFACEQDHRALVVGKIQKASKLATTEFTVDKIVFGQKSKKIAFFIPLKDALFVAYSKAKVKTGVDLDKLSRHDVSIDGKSISITLPAVEVINFSYPPDLFEIDRNMSVNSWQNDINLMDQEKLFRAAEIDIRNNLAYMGIVKTTQTRTTTMLRTMLKSLGYEEIYIRFKTDNLIIDTVPEEKQES